MWNRQICSTLAYFSQLRLANVCTAFVRSEPRPGAALASIVPSGDAPGRGFEQLRKGAKNRLSKEKIVSGKER